MRNIFPTKALLFIILSCFIGYIAKGQGTPDPGLPGPFSVVKAEYNLGDRAWKPPTYPDSVEVAGSVHYPSVMSAGPFPVIVYLHGRHESCYDTTNPTNTSADWPCKGVFKSLPSYEGYDYAARTMASHGYIVISISCNAINAGDDTVADYGMHGRGELVQHHLDLWNTYNTTGGYPFGTTFVGKLNMQNVGTMGHSRGGEGVVFNALYNQSLGSPYGIKAVLTLAPVDFLRKVLHNVPLLNIAPYCDGDVADLQGVHFYDDARYSDTTDNAPKHSVLFMGANHNYFNTMWTPGSSIAGAEDDWLYYFSASNSHCGTSAARRFDTTKQKAAFNSYSAAFYRLYLGHETQFAPILDVADIVPPASSLLDSADVYVSYHPARVDRLDVNRTDSLRTDTLNTLRGHAMTSGLVSSQICGGGFSEPDCGVTTNQGQKPHDGDTYTEGLSQKSLRWNDTTDLYQNELPAGYQNLRPFESLLFRASVNFHNSPSGVNLDYTVQLIDSSGHVSNAVVSHFSHALFFQPGVQPYDLPKMVFNTVNIPLSSFSGVSMDKIRYVRFLFNKVNVGSLFISDLSFSNPLCGNADAIFNYAMAGHYHVIFTNTPFANSGDSMSWHWVFGDALSGVYDTSSVQNPSHIFHGPGTYHPCLYVTSYRKNSLVCTDSFCTTIVLANDGVEELGNSKISIVPNPAHDYLYVSGSERTDMFKLIDLFGREVLSTSLADPMVYLPASLANGVYTAVVISGRERVFRKLVVMR